MQIIFSVSVSESVIHKYRALLYNACKYMFVLVLLQPCRNWPVAWDPSFEGRSRYQRAEQTVFF